MRGESGGIVAYRVGLFVLWERAWKRDQGDRSFPNDAIVGSTRVPASVRSSLTRWLLSPDERSQELLAELFQVRSFRVASSVHFDSLRHMVRAARARGYDG